MGTRKEFNHIATVSEAQVVFGDRLGLDLRGCTVRVALARIENMIDVGFKGAEPGHPTQKQIALAGKFGYDISALSRREADAVIDDLMEQLNHEAIESEGLAPGVAVVNIHDPASKQCTISSIYPNGTVYFRRGQGQRAWARSLKRVKD